MKNRFFNVTFLNFVIVLVFIVFLDTNAQIGNTPAEAKKWADETLAKLPLEKKIGQIICTDIFGG